MKLRQIFRLYYSRFGKNFQRFTWGGSWASALSAEKRQNLTLYFYDGLFAAASDKIILTYLTLYLLTFGATRQQIGLLSSLSNFTAAFLLLPAAMLVERTGERKKITVSSASASRLAVVMMALLPLFIHKVSALIWVILALALLREAFNNIGFPGWMAITGDIVPIQGRGRYFGTRNFFMGVAGIVSALVVGEAITKIGAPFGYQLAFFIAAALGVISISFFARLKDPHQKNNNNHPQHNQPPKEDNQESFQPIAGGFKGIINSLKGQSLFINFCIYNALWNFSINIAGPFFDVYLVDTLKFTAAMIGVTTVANTIATLIVQRRVGLMADKWGNRNVTIVILLLIPLLPIAWGLWVKQYWQVILIQIIGGILWGAFNLVSFNNLLMQTPHTQRARFSAVYQIIVTLSLAGGAGLGSLLIASIDFKGVTLASAGMRWLAGLFFVFMVREPEISE